MTAMKRKVLPARFYRTATGAEPVRKWPKALSREDKRDRGDGHRYGRIRVAGGYANLSGVGVKARTFGGEELSDPKPDRARPVLYTSRRDGAPAWVHQEDTADARERFGPRCEAAEGG